MLVKNSATTGKLGRHQRTPCLTSCTLGGGTAMRPRYRLRIPNEPSPTEGHLASGFGMNVAFMET